MPEAWRVLAKPPRGGYKPDPFRNLDARAKVFLDRIAPLSADLAAHRRTRALALKKAAQNVRGRSPSGRAELDD